MTEAKEIPARRALRNGEVELDMAAISFLKAGRIALNWSQERLAKEAGLSSGTIKNLERSIREDESRKSIASDPKVYFTRFETVRNIMSALEREGVMISFESGKYCLTLDPSGGTGHMFAHALSLSKRSQE